jgi:hypothetical protein
VAPSFNINPWYADRVQLYLSCRSSVLQSRDCQAAVEPLHYRRGSDYRSL